MSRKLLSTMRTIGDWASHLTALVGWWLLLMLAVYRIQYPEIDIIGMVSEPTLRMLKSQQPAALIIFGSVPLVPMAWEAMTDWLQRRQSQQPDPAP